MTWSALGCLEMGNLTTQETHMVIFMVNQDNQPSIFQGYSLFSYTHGCQFTMHSLVRHSPVDLLIFWHFNQFNHHLHYETHAGTPFLDTEPPKNQPESTHSSCGLCLAPCTNLDAERPSRTSPVVLSTTPSPTSEGHEMPPKKCAADAMLQSRQWDEPELKMGTSDWRMNLDVPRDDSYSSYDPRIPWSTFWKNTTGHTATLAIHDFWCFLYQI